MTTPKGIQTPGLFSFTRQGRVNFGFSGMTAASRIAAAAIGSKQEEGDTDINFRMERYQMGEGFNLLGLVYMVIIIFN